MGQRVIPCAVTAEYVAGDGVTLGAAGSHNSVVIEYDFRAAGPMWEGTTRYVLWTNPQGNTTNRVDLGVDKLVSGYDNVYHASPTADAMCVAGWAEMVVVGVTVDGSTETLKVKTEPSRFRVLPGSSSAADNEGVAATVADQLQTEIESAYDRLNAKKVNKPVAPYLENGIKGQYLTTLGNGATAWVDAPKPTQAQVNQALEEHPWWVTTVDYKITEKVLDCVDDMVGDIALEAGDHVRTAGYYEANDGGGARYLIRSIQPIDNIGVIADGTTSQDGLVRLSNGLCAQLLLEEGRLNLRCAGLKNDTENDQYIRFFNAMHIPGVTEFYLPAGYYITSDVLLIPPNTEFVGDGKSSVLYYNAVYGNFGGGMTNGGSNIAVRKLSIEHQGTPGMYDEEHWGKSFLGGMGFSNYRFDSWTEPHILANEMQKGPCSNLTFEEIYSDSIYPIQTEPSGYAISDVTYRHIIAPNGCVSVYPQQAAEGGILENVSVDHVEALVFRIGSGGDGGRNIVVNDVKAVMCGFLSNGIRASNIVCDCSGTVSVRWYDAALTLKGDRFFLDHIALIGGDPEIELAIRNKVVGEVFLSDSKVTGFQRLWGNNISAPFVVHLANCDFDTTDAPLIRDATGSAIGCNRIEGETLGQDIFNSFFMSLAGGASKTVRFTKIGLVFVRSNVGALGNVSLYIASYGDDTFRLDPIFVSTGTELTATADPTYGTITITNESANYAFIGVIAI